jgi:hypothetical protein
VKFLRSLVFFGIVLFLGIHFGSNYLVAQGFESWLGVPVQVSSVRWGLSSHQLVLKNVRIQNPSGYNSKYLARMSRIQADYDASDLKHGLFKISRLEVHVEEIQLERKSISESNILELSPLRAALHQELTTPKKKGIPISFQIERVKLEMGNVVFATQLGNDQVIQSRKIESPPGDLLELTNPDRVLVYISLLALQSAGWQALLPTQTQVAAEIQSQFNGWVEKVKQQAQVWQAQVNQMIDEKLKK